MSSARAMPLKDEIKDEEDGEDDVPIALSMRGKKNGSGKKSNAELSAVKKEEPTEQEDDDEKDEEEEDDDEEEEEEEEEYEEEKPKKNKKTPMKERGRAKKMPAKKKEEKKKPTSKSEKAENKKRVGKDDKTVSTGNEEKTENKKVTKKVKERKVYVLPGQKHDPPEERDASRIFYESLYQQVPTSEMANIWMMERGLLPPEIAAIVYEMKSKKGQVKSPLKSVSAGKTKEVSVQGMKKEFLTKKEVTMKEEVTVKTETKMLKKRKTACDGSDDDEDDDFIIPKKKIKRELM